METLAQLFTNLLHQTTPVTAPVPLVLAPSHPPSQPSYDHLETWQIFPL